MTGMTREVTELLQVFKDHGKGKKPGNCLDVLVAALIVSASKSKDCKCVNQNGSSNQNNVHVETGQ